MATSFHDREQAFEAKFAHDQELRFLVIARRDKLLAQWVAKRQGMAKAAGEKLQQKMLAVPDGSGHDAALLDCISKALPPERGGPDKTALALALQSCLRQAEQDLLDNPAGRRPLNLM